MQAALYRSLVSSAMSALKASSERSVVTRSGNTDNEILSEVLVMPLGKHALPVLVFENDEQGYLRWVARNRSGYVVNAKRLMDRDDDWVVLHKATCGTIQGQPKVWTSGVYLKVCADSKSLALRWIRRNYNTKAHNCSRCF